MVQVIEIPEGRYIMYGKIIDYITEHNLINKGDKIVIGLSGGADSVSLFLILCKLKEEYNLELYAVHVNHCIRGEEALLDADFCRELAEKYEVPYRCAVVDVPMLAARLKLTEEETGRKVRYEEFEKELISRGADKIAVAHHMNDNVETILYRMCRGTGIKGMTGIPCKRDNIIRPLLGVRREEITAYLAMRNQDYREDATNACTDYDRNKVRNTIIPELESINSGTVAHIDSLSKQLESIYSWYADSVKEAFDKYIICRHGERIVEINSLIDMHPALRGELIRLMIGELTSSLKDIEHRHIDGILALINGDSGSSINLPYSLKAENEYGTIRISVITNEESGNTKTDSTKNGSTKQSEMVIEEPGYSGEWQQVYLPDTGCYRESISLRTEVVACVPAATDIPKNYCTKWVDYDKIIGKPIVRRVSSEDYIYVNGNCKKKLGSYLIDSKIPRRYRDKLLVVADGNHVLWVVGGRASEGGYVDGKTRRILTVTIE